MAVHPRNNLNPIERLISIGSGVALALSALRQRGLVRRLALAAAAASALTRGASGYCGMKAVLAGENSVSDAVREQWRRIRSVAAPTGDEAGGAIDTLANLYTREVRELYSAELQFGSLLDELDTGLASVPLQHALEGYATEVYSRGEDLERLLGNVNGEGLRTADAGMRGLVAAAHDALHISGPAVRDAALAGSVQRLLHYKIAGYGTAAAHAKSLGRDEHASRLAEYADRDKAFDVQLSDLGVRSLNPQASSESRARAAAGPSPLAVNGSSRGRTRDPAS